MSSSSSSPPPAPPSSPKYGGFSRFEIELEFIQALSNPLYLLHLATTTTPTTNPPTPLLHHPPFIAYLSYLRYFARPPYTQYLTYPGPTLKNLEFLQNERFRKDVLSPEVVSRLGEEGVRAVLEGLGVGAAGGGGVGPGGKV